MSKAWIEELAEDIKHKNHEAAEEYGRAQHRNGVITAQGRIFFTDLVRILEDNITQLRAQLQGDPASADLAIQTTGATHVHITRSRFPWVDATILHHDPTITLEYAKDPGITGDPAIAERKTLIFDFHVAPDDKLSVQDAFGDTPHSYATPEDLARRITEILFAA